MDVAAPPPPPPPCAGPAITFGGILAPALWAPVIIAVAVTRA